MINKRQKFKASSFLLLYLALVIFLNNCSEKKRYPSIEQTLNSESSQLLSHSNIIVYHDKSCDFCLKNIEYYITHNAEMPFYLIYLTATSKVKYEDLSAEIRKTIPKEQFFLSNNPELFEKLAKETDNYKGGYLIKTDGSKRIESIEPIENN